MRRGMTVRGLFPVVEALLGDPEGVGLGRRVWG